MRGLGSINKKEDLQVADLGLSRNAKRFRGGLVFKAHRLLHHSTLGLRVKKKKKGCVETDAGLPKRGKSLSCTSGWECNAGSDQDLSRRVFVIDTR